MKNNEAEYDASLSWKIAHQHRGSKPRRKRALYAMAFVVATLPLAPWAHAQPPSAPAPLSAVAGSSDWLCQLVGEESYNDTASDFGLVGADLGYSFEHDGQLRFLFGDAWRPTNRNDPDALASSSFFACWDLTFAATGNGDFAQMLFVGGNVSTGALETPLGGVSVNGDAYVMFGTNTPSPRAIVGKERDLSIAAFDYAGEFSTDKFLNPAITKTDDPNAFGDLGDLGEMVVVAGRRGFGTAASMQETFVAITFPSWFPATMFYFAGFTSGGASMWSLHENDAAPVFAGDATRPVFYQHSLQWVPALEQWVIMYGGQHSWGNTADNGVFVRTARAPWGPWSAPTRVYNPYVDPGYCDFIHDNGTQGCGPDSLADDSPNHPTPLMPGFTYGALMVEPYTGCEEQTWGTECDLYFTLSSWNPYRTHLMRTTVRKLDFGITR